MNDVFVPWYLKSRGIGMVLMVLFLNVIRPVWERLFTRFIAWRIMKGKKPR